MPTGRRTARTTRRQPSFEGLEVRALRSNLPGAVSVSVANPAVTQWLVGQVYGPVTGPNGQSYPVPQPTPAEVKRETFISKFVGNYDITLPRSADRAPSIHIYSQGNNAGSNQFVHGRAQLLILPPANPDATPNPKTDPIANKVVGLVSFIPSNFLQTSGDLMFDILNLPGVASNDPSALDHGLPSQLYWTLDQAGAGQYTQPTYTYDTLLGTGTAGVAPGGAGGAAAWTAGAGIISLQYIPSAHPAHGTLGSGQVIVTIQGLFNNPGDLSAINAQMNE